MNDQLFSAAAEVDRSFLILFSFSVFMLVAITVCMLFFLWRYNVKRHPRADDSKGNVWVEIIWTVLPTIIVIGLFWTGWSSFKAMRTIPDEAMEILVEGRMWSWKFTYPDGKTSNELVVPVGEPVRLTMSTRDVIHSFYVPALRLKWDTVPGMNTEVWFQADVPGEYDIFCAEYCGLKHADMVTLLKVVPQAEYDAWLGAEKQKAKGAALLQEYGCLDCHSTDGSEGAGPTLKGIAGSMRTVRLADGKLSKTLADEEYLRRAILDPGSEVLAGWDDFMPPYEGQISEEDLTAMVVVIKSLNAGPEVPAGQKLAEEQGCVDCHSTDGSEGMGPTLLDLYGKRRLVRRGGIVLEAVADEAYLHRAIVDPGKDIPDGFEDMMPSYDALDEESVNLLVDWIRSLRSGEAEEE